MQFYVSFLHCAHDLGFNICAQTFSKRGLCVVFCKALFDHILKFLHYCEDLMSVIVVCKARSHDLLSSCIEPSCV
jgi:hypothetical protein